MNGRSPGRILLFTFLAWLVASVLGMAIAAHDPLAALLAVAGVTFLMAGAMLVELLLFPFSHRNWFEQNWPLYLFLLPLCLTPLALLFQAGYTFITRM